MKFVMGFDTETTGLKAHDGDKLIEIALLTYDMDTRKLVDSYVQRIDPERNIAAAAQEIHGISYDDLVGQPKFRDIASEVHQRFEKADLIIAHNLNFDAMFLLEEFSAVGMMFPNGAGLDTMTNARWACSNGKYPKLGELCWALGVKYDPDSAHSASYDTEVMMECFWKGLDRGFYKLPEVTAKATA